MPKQLRQLFAVLLLFCEPSDPLTLWNEYKHCMIEDYCHRMSADHAEQSALSKIEKVIKQSGKSLADYNLPAIFDLPVDIDDDVNNEYAHQADFMRPFLNPVQNDIANEIIVAVQNIRNNVQQDTRLFYVDGPGGSGKTFLYNYLISELGAQGYNVKSCAYTGIAATLLFFGGSTTHSLFGLPVPILETSVCRISPTSEKAEMLRNVDIFIVDEVSMISTHAFHAIDRMLQDITKNKLLFY